MLSELYLDPLHLSANRLALELRIPQSRLALIVRGRRAISADTALRLARHLGTSAQFWMNLQARYDLETAEDAIGRTVMREVPVGPYTSAS